MFEVSADLHTLSAKVAEQLQQAIANGQFRPGDRLPSERELVARFGVSRTVIRDALKVLAGTGIVEVRRGAGAFVTTAALDVSATNLRSLLETKKGKVRNLFEIRLVLESEGAAWAALRATPDQRVRLYEHVAAARQALFEGRFDVEAANRHNQEFHHMVAEASGNELLPALVTSLRTMLEEPGRRETLRRREWAERVVDEHQRVVAAILFRDPEGARWAMRQHLRDVEQEEIKRLGTLVESLHTGEPGTAGSVSVAAQHQE